MFYAFKASPPGNKRTLYKRNMPHSSFTPVKYNNYTIKSYFLFRCLSLPTKFNKISLFGVGVSGIC